MRLALAPLNLPIICCLNLAARNEPGTLCGLCHPTISLRVNSTDMFTTHIKPALHL